MSNRILLLIVWCVIRLVCRSIVVSQTVRSRLDQVSHIPVSVDRPIGYGRGLPSTWQWGTSPAGPRTPIGRRSATTLATMTRRRFDCDCGTPWKLVRDWPAPSTPGTAVRPPTTSVSQTTRLVPLSCWPTSTRSATSSLREVIV